MCTVRNPKWSQIFSPDGDMPISLLWQNSWLCLQFLCNKKGKKHSGLCECLTEVRVWLEMIVYHHMSHFEEPCKHSPSPLTPFFLTQKLHTSKEKLPQSDENVWAIVEANVSLMMLLFVLAYLNQKILKPFPFSNYFLSLCQCQCIVPAANQASP